MFNVGVAFQFPAFKREHAQTDQTSVAAGQVSSINYSQFAVSIIATRRANYDQSPHPLGRL